MKKTAPVRGRALFLKLSWVCLVPPFFSILTSKSAKFGPRRVLKPYFVQKSNFQKNERHAAWEHDFDPKAGLKTAQDRPKTLSLGTLFGAKIEKKDDQNFISSKDGPKIAPRRPQEAPGPPQDAPMRPPGPPKRTPGAPQEAFESLQDTPKWFSEACSPTFFLRNESLTKQTSMSRKNNSLAISSTQNGRKVERPNEKVKTKRVAAVVARSALQSAAPGAARESVL